MERIAFIAGPYVISWNALILVFAAAVAACLFLALYLSRDGGAEGFAAVPLALVLSVALSRFVHWYCYEDSYESLRSAMTDYSCGGYALVGVFIGCALAAVLLRLVRLSRNLPEMLDCMCLAGAAGVAIGRLSSLFNSSDRGQMMESIRSMPWVYPVVNVTSGVTEYRLATFMLQAMVAAALFAVLTVFWLTGKKRGLKDGDTSMIFLMIYGASQIVLDSTRYDSMYFRSNGFVSIVQVLSLVVLVITIAIFSVRMVRAQGFRKWYAVLWVLILALLGGAGYMEYYVQRHGNEAAMAYSIMSACLALTVLLALVIRFEAENSFEELMKKFKKTGCP